MLGTQTVFPVCWHSRVGRDSTEMHLPCRTQAALHKFPIHPLIAATWLKQAHIRRHIRTVLTTLAGSNRSCQQLDQSLDALVRTWLDTRGYHSKSSRSVDALWRFLIRALNCSSCTNRLEEKRLHKTSQSIKLWDRNLQKPFVSLCFLSCWSLNLQVILPLLHRLSKEMAAQPLSRESCSLRDVKSWVDRWLSGRAWRAWLWAVINFW